ncbi:glycosyltransferase [Haloferula sargassicola]|uniref:LicD/FKTN/FKRP nucleotidyltransferase domain-containing protein n=1 Tax=Haloferula sargassicola TaxID=490096 RepID=A0ABP9UUW6_9BACT
MFDVMSNYVNDFDEGMPRKIWQTWKHSRIPSALMRCAKSFGLLNPGWTVDLATDAEITSLIDSEFPELKELIERFPGGVYVADIWRCLVLYRFGGVYADLDVECIQPLDDLLAAIDAAGLNGNDAEVFLPRDHPVHEEGHYGGREMYMNFFMIAKPGARFFKAYIDRLVRIASEREGPISGGVINLTGPGAFAELVEEAGSPAALGLSILPWEWLSPLPNMSASWGRETLREYDELIRRGDWAWELNPFVAHYWWHNYHDPRSTISMYGSMLFQSDGRIVNRRLDKILPEDDPGSDFLGRTLAEYAELEEGSFVESSLQESQTLLCRLADEAFEGLERIRLSELPEEGGRIGLLEIGDDDGKSLRRFEVALEKQLFAPKGLVCLAGEGGATNEAREKLLKLALANGFELLEDQGGILLQAPDPNDRVLIPKVIHQTWKDHSIPEDFRKEWIDSWMEKNGPNGWEYRFWTDEDLLALVEEEFPEFIDCYLDYDQPIKRVDAARYLILKRHGGLYVDLDFVCLKPFDDLLKRQSLMFGSEYDSPERHQDSVCNALMASIAEHPFWTGIEADLMASARDGVLAATGPRFLGQRLRNSTWFLEKKDWPTVVRKEVFYPFRWNEEEREAAREASVEELAARYPDSHAVTLWNGTWLKTEGGGAFQNPGGAMRVGTRGDSPFTESGAGTNGHSAPKHFQEAGGGHYDARYFREVVDSTTAREVLLQLSGEFVSMCEASGVQPILMHGGLLGWFWSGKPFPWDDDLDFCLLHEDLKRLDARTVRESGYDELNYLFEINPNHLNRTSANGHWKENREQNKIDARFIHRDTGLFIDITALASEEGLLVTKCPHRYRKKNLLPLSEADFCGTKVHVPANPQAVLEQEYGWKALTEPVFRDWIFDCFLKDWIKNEPQAAPKPWDGMESGPLLHVRPDARAFRRERKRLGPMQAIYNEEVDAEVAELSEYEGDLRSWLAMACESVEEAWWIDLNPAIRMGNFGADLFLDRSYDRADLVVCGSFFMRLTEEMFAWARGRGLDGWQPEMLVKVPKLEGPATLWRAEFGRRFLAVWSETPGEIRPELLVKALVEEGAAAVAETTAGRMGWRVR